MAVRTRRNGRRMEKMEEKKAGGLGDRKGEGSEGRHRRRRVGNKRAGAGGCVSLLSCPAPSKGLSLVCF